MISESVTRFSGKVCLVTGASTGIGLACAEYFTQQGAQVFCAQRSQSEDQKNRFTWIPADFENNEAPEQVIETVIAQAGKLDVLINNAGIMQEGTAETMSLEAWEKTLRVNLTAPFLLIKYAIPHLRKTKGAIVN